jgi:bifunctional UDP-N-acetylglucosamine pyrophosphorylase/glucosamine-1-phosphate N-acetyltransferase
MSQTRSRPRVAVILAAGKGTRMRSELPKVLHRAAGRPLLQWVVDAARGAGCERILVVIGHGADQVREEISGEDLAWVLQAEQKGTGHALAQTEAEVGGDALLLVLSGDVPLITPATLAELAAAAESGWGSMAVAELDQPGSLGRVLTGADGSLVGIVEARDTTNPDVLAIRRINSGLYALPAPDIFHYLRGLDTDNAQGELYLTDAVTAAARDGRRVELLRLENPDEALGVNTQDELAEIHRRLIERHREA